MKLPRVWRSVCICWFWLAGIWSWSLKARSATRWAGGWCCQTGWVLLSLTTVCYVNQTDFSVEISWQCYRPRSPLLMRFAVEGTIPRLNKRSVKQSHQGSHRCWTYPATGPRCCLLVLARLNEFYILTINFSVDRVGVMKSTVSTGQ